MYPFDRQYALFLFRLFPAFQTLEIVKKCKEVLRDDINTELATCFTKPLEKNFTSCVIKYSSLPLVVIHDNCNFSIISTYLRPPRVKPSSLLRFQDCCKFYNCQNTFYSTFKILNIGLKIIIINIFYCMYVHICYDCKIFGRIHEDALFKQPAEI